MRSDNAHPNPSDHSRTGLPTIARCIQSAGNGDQVGPGMMQRRSLRSAKQADRPQKAGRRASKNCTRFVKELA